MPAFVLAFNSVRSDPVDTYYEYLRTYAQELGSRIVEMYPPLQGPQDAIAEPIYGLLRKPLPAQALTISGLAKHLTTGRRFALSANVGRERR